MSRVPSGLTPILAMLGVALAVAACSGGPEGAEAELRALVDEAEIAAEDRDVGDLMDLVHENYVGSDLDGSGGADRMDLRKALHVYFVANQRVHAITRINEVRLLADDLARVELAVAVAGRPLEAVEALSETRADLFLVTLDLAYDGSWKVIAADARDASPADFL